jgi:ATP-dependent Lhr-like helicase
VLGEIEEYFIEQMAPGDTFLFGGEVLRFEGLRENEAYVSRAQIRQSDDPVLHGRQVSALHLSRRERACDAGNAAQLESLPGQVREWLEIQRDKSVLPARDGLLVETFPSANKHYMVCYPFEGRLAHQTLGMLLTKRLERLGAPIQSASSPTTMRWRSGGSATCRFCFPPAKSRSTGCSRRTSSATISTPGWPSPA